MMRKDREHHERRSSREQGRCGEIINIGNDSEREARSDSPLSQRKKRTGTRERN